MYHIFGSKEEDIQASDLEVPTGEDGLTKMASSGTESDCQLCAQVKDQCECPQDSSTNNNSITTTVSPALDEEGEEPADPSCMESSLHNLKMRAELRKVSLRQSCGSLGVIEKQAEDSEQEEEEDNQDTRSNTVDKPPAPQSKIPLKKKIMLAFRQR